VMIAIKGKQGQAIDEIQVGCTKLLANAVMNSDVEWTGRWDILDNGGNGFERKCATGWVVTGIQGTVHRDSRQIRSITLQCKPGRPAQAIRAQAEVFLPVPPFIFPPWIITGVQLSCQQPVVP
jgi:hypothetical protein